MAEFVIEKLDVTSLPAEFRPKHEKGKKTLRDYGYVTQEISEDDALVEFSKTKSQISIKFLEQSEAGLYVCINGRDSRDEDVRRVLFLQRNGENALLKGRVSWKEFASCPVVGGDAEASTAPGD